MSKIDKRMLWLPVIVIPAILIIMLCGCGAIGDLRYVPPGETPPAGSKSLIEAAADVSESGVGDVVQVLAGFIGCGGAVALGRKVLRDRANRRKMREQEIALREIIAGVEEVADSGSSLKRTLGMHQKTESTRRIVANMKVDNGTVSDKD